MNNKVGLKMALVPNRLTVFCTNISMVACQRLNSIPCNGLPGKFLLEVRTFFS